ncbi:PREDICTED: uncharacterized protein LOC104756989 [Camelina sativa]|uniref:Uncharacterized protein LOC104756989 n=1 Tax=Camelina sativa TaxID=90675 RepID=A0ABM0WYG4_CAMSA|nr:PREDICTED: uncharacterized protein LOC104756989 [Camelina sativa]
MAIASRVSNLDSEVVELRQKLVDKENAGLCVSLRRKASRLERDCPEADSRLKIVLEDNMNLTKEKDSLAMTVTKLTRDLAKLETFKRQLIKSLSDESGPPQTEPVDIQDMRPVNSWTRQNYSGSTDMTNPGVEASKYTGNKFEDQNLDFGTEGERS